jgi:hypothetical protein
MAYEGEILRACPADIDFANTWAVVVSGAKANPCGHMLFCCGTSSDDCWYFHVAGQGVKEAIGFYAYPKFMRGDENYNHYLTANDKKEIRRLSARISNPSGAYEKLIKSMADKWLWGVLAHNCAVFARDIIAAGGGALEVLLNCPDQEFAGKAQDVLNRIGEAYLKSLPYGLGI